MKICVVGAGAIGGLMAVRLHAAGAEVSVVARGPHLAAIQAGGLTLIEGSRVTNARVKATSDIAELGPQDLVILGLKAHQVSSVVDKLEGLYGPETMVLTAQNGIPWWYFFKHGGPWDGRRLESVDPGGQIAARLPIDRVIATVVYPAAEIISPGVVQFVEGVRFSLAEIDNSRTPRLEQLSKALSHAGFRAPIVTDVRAEIWTKLWGNMSFNPISALTHSTLEGLCRFPLTRALVGDLMREAQTVGEKLGVRFRVPIEKRIAGGEAVGAHKTSMLQDVEAGRALEADALLGSVIELARLVEVPTPHLDSVYALVKLLDHELQTARSGLKIANA